MKRFLILILLLLCTTTFASQKLVILVNDKPISSDVEPFIKNGTTYVPIRFIANALNIDKITWNDSTKSVYIKNDSTSILLLVNQNYAYVNNEYKALSNNALLVNGRTFVPLRFVSEILGANVVWDQNSYTVAISTTSNLQDTSTIASSPSISLPVKNSVDTPVSSTINVTTSSSNSNISTNSVPNKADNSNKNTVIENTNQTTINIDTADNKNTNIDTSNVQTTSNSTPLLDEDAIYWLSKIIEAEATGEPYIGKVAVGEVILNRVKSEDFPNTIWGVIFDDNFGIQFEPVKNGAIYNTPSEESINAAKEALGGSKHIGDCLYFLNPKKSKSPWIVNNRQYYTTIANHDFYA